MDFDITGIPELLDARHTPNQVMLVNQGHSWGQWRTELDDMLIYFYGAHS